MFLARLSSLVLFAYYIKLLISLIDFLVAVVATLGGVLEFVATFDPDNAAFKFLSLT
jgi:hypothetical protein